MKSDKFFKKLVKEARNSLKMMSYMAIETAIDNKEKTREIISYCQRVERGFDILYCAVCNTELERTRNSLTKLYYIAKEKVKYNEELATLCNHYLKVKKALDFVEMRTKQ